MRWCELCKYYVEDRGLVFCSGGEILFHYLDCDKYRKAREVWEVIQHKREVFNEL